MLRFFIMCNIKRKYLFMTPITEGTKKFKLLPEEIDEPDRSKPFFVAVINLNQEINEMINEFER